MGIIKRSSATSLAGWIVLLVALLCAITVTAYAVTRSGAPKPPKRSLASAVHNALTQRPVTGVSAQFSVDEHLLAGTSTTFSTSPLAGATGSVWFGGGHVRLLVKSQLGTTVVAYDGSRVTLYDRKQHTAYELPVTHHTAAKSDTADAHAVPSIAAIERAITRAGSFAVLSGAIPSNVAGREAYTVHVSPRRNGGLFGDFELAWDAAHAVPLRFAIYPRGSSTAAVSITVTHISYGPVAPAKLALTLPAGTKIVHVHMPSHHMQSEKPHVAPAIGAAAVSKAVGFTVAAPETLAGLPQGQVRSVDMGKTPAALVTYGRGLGTVFVLEQHASGDKGPLAALPSASIDGMAGRELDTTLGSLIQFNRGGITYTVVGSQTAATIMTAAQALA
ncbi:MAG TPA: hypothetical protein VGL44_16710 [Gaiellales bacterium]